MTLDFLNDTKYTRAFVLAAVLFGIVDACLAWGAAQTAEKARAAAGEAAALEVWQREDKPESRMDFYRHLFTRDTAEGVSAPFTDAGCTVEEITEEERERDGFAERLFRVRGRGSFSQILTAFDIMENKDNWNSPSIVSLAPDGGRLAFDCEVRTMEMKTAAP